MDINRIKKYFNNKGYIPYWLAKIIAGFGFDHYEYSRTYYDPNKKIVWIGGFKPTNNMYSAILWKKFFNQIFNKKNWK